MYISNENIARELAQATKAKWDNIIIENKPFLCKKCNKFKLPSEFVTQYIRNSLVGRYQYLYECKSCKKNRIYQRRIIVRSSLEGAFEIIFKKLKSIAKQRNLEFLITYEDLLNKWHSQQGKCYFTGYDMNFEYINYKSGNQEENTLMQVYCDRINHSIGYLKNNIILCCNFVYKMKGNFSVNKFIKICQDINNNLS